jgi:hypothetical protein
VLVPAIPDNGMCIAGGELLAAHDEQDGHFDHTAQEMWKVMLAAAPSPVHGGKTPSGVE